MSSDDESRGDPMWVPYSQRPEWKDVTPIPQPENDFEVVKIAYSDKFRDIYDYYRAIIQSGEVSERALELTKDAAEENPANYSVWHTRRKLLKALNKNLDEEFQYSRHIIEENPKNYQVWQHRRVLVEWTNSPTKEKRLTEMILSIDAKNYHAWQHRQWVIQTFDLYDGELEFLDRLLEEDIRNNSAWNQRFFMVTHMSKPDRRVRGDVLRTEMEYAIKKLRIVPNNESPWNYIRGLVEQSEDGDPTNPRSLLSDICNELYEKGERNHHLMATMIDVASNVMEEKRKAGGEVEEELQKTLQMCNSLATDVDVIRKEYWEFVERSLVNRFRSAA